MIWQVLVILLSLCAVRAHPAGPKARRETPTSLTVHAVPNPHYKVDGPREYLRALSKWGADIPDALLEYTSTKGEITSVAAYNQTNDREYLSPVSIGNPPQEVLLDIDTGSSDLWVFSSETVVQDPFPSRKKWNISQSATAKAVNGSGWSIIYGDGSYAMGTVWKDDVYLGGLAVHNAIVESATTVSPFLVDDANISGLLGLAYRHASQVSPRQPTFLDLLEPQLANPVFTVDLRYHDVGLYQFGAVDHARHVGNISWVPLSDGALFWQFAFSSLNVAPSNVWLLSTWPAIADTGTSLLLLPPDLVELYYAQVPGAVIDPTYRLWVFPCDNPVLPDFHVGFVDGWHATIPGAYINYTALESTTPSVNGSWSLACLGGIQENMGLSFSIFGDIFLKAVFAVFDREGAQVGFADKSASV
ncbi:hypothetical protein VTK73DRAFT_6770 [Phialemonium thermophilum]|uniref:Peptidase A1 domain-containing protein n=1 Tax=Phialemonium thermophilum TaxID=223376 RepID=A0ABR3WHZ6_9PEZI